MIVPTLSQTPDLGEVLRMIERRVARLERVSGGFANTDVTFVASLTITGLTLASQTVTVFNDDYNVYMRFTWNAIPTDPNNFNPDPVTDYLTSWTTDGTNWSAEQSTTDTFATIGGFSQSQVVTFRVRAHTKNNSLGPYATSSNTTTADNTAPGQPATPTVVPYLGQLRITWNGLNSSAGAMPADFKFTEVHMSTTSITFTPTSATLKGTILKGGGDWIVTDLAYGTTYFFRLVAVDNVGNRSPSSVGASAIPEQVVNADVGPNAIDTANIVNLAVNNAKIADLSVGKLTAGTLSAVVTISGRIATALTGARVEMNINGIQAFNSSGAQTVNIDGATGNATFTGTFQTDFASATTPHIFMQNSGDRTTIFFTDSSGLGASGNAAFMNTPADVGGAPRVGINTGAFFYFTSVAAKHRLFLNNASGIFLETFATTGGFNLGGRLVLTDGGSSMSNYLSGGAQTGGFLYIDNNQAIVGRNGSGTPNGGYTQLDGTTARYNVQNTGIIAAEILLQDNESIWIRGRFQADNADSGKGAVVCGTFNAGAATSFSVSYAVTMSTRPQAIYSLQSGSGIGDHRLSAFSTVSFTVLTQNSVAVNLNYWNFRTNP